MKKILLFAGLLTSFFTYAQDFNRNKMDSLFALIEQHNRGMGSISIFQSGEEVYQNSIGYASVADEIEAVKNTKYRIGSITKMFTATVIMQLIEEDQLSLNTTLDQFFPEVKNADKITIKHLLKHQSGIFNFTNAPDYATYMEKPISKETMVKKISEFDSNFEPGSKSAYSNSNYVLLTFIAEQIDQSTYGEIIEKRITSRCNLENTSVGSKIQPENNEALSYNKSADWESATETHMSVPVGAGAIVSTPEDLNRFLRCLFKGQLVANKSLEKMMNIENGLGIGMFQVPFYNKKAFGHTGGIDGFQANSFYFPDEKTAISYTSNAVDMPVNDIMIGVLSIYFDRPYKLPTFEPNVEISEKTLKNYEGVYASTDLPIKLTITKREGSLIAQGTGQPAFPLTAVSNTKFKYDQAQLKIEFIPGENKMVLEQMGKRYELEKE
ncbi:D-alanyl-D-alanine carboxypeptidase precursor [Salinivirga cyanobacteriivorans]|uniref:D-alanyl-D-alanine carboxypeptidase n=1 Tax=Salinivirga cyanobacteriivorans TaxID=1307839 RepID=A0A0S2I1M2_9BACT|nr:serine hydrolase domain-containing protein [Salinivirga cyanobacteriivorans]ALO16178.1 D-alanyl-D-alanine carboxypeptidase precursor [Salinivirga cyanobacteriivorans]